MSNETSRLVPLAYAPAAAVALALLAACSGGGGGGDDGGGQPTNVVINGRITFDRIPFSATAGQGLTPTAPMVSPARQVIVEAIDAGNNAVLATTSTDTAGDYSLTVPASRNLFIRAKAQMLKTGTAPTWDFSVRNNTNGDALYALDGSASSSGTTNSTRDLRAPSGWGTTSYTGTRAAAPFAILDTVFRAKELVLTAASTQAFPALSLFWSTTNKPAGPFCPDNGNIGTSSYVVFGATDTDECTVPNLGVTGIYVLGDFTQGDTDEFDQHVIAHEWGHYFEDRFSRSDSIGGSHGGGDQLDLRVAFGEGWGNAYSGMTLNDPFYRDSFSGVSQDFGINLESDASGTGNPEGWFSEFSVGEILWDIFDGAGEAGDTVALGFPPIFAAMTGPASEHGCADQYLPVCGGDAQRECRLGRRHLGLVERRVDLRQRRVRHGRDQQWRRSERAAGLPADRAQHTVARVQHFDRRQR